MQDRLRAAAAAVVGQPRAALLGRQQLRLRHRQQQEVCGMIVMSGIWNLNPSIPQVKRRRGGGGPEEVRRAISAAASVGQV